jgi:hypothetical protein
MRVACLLLIILSWIFLFAQESESSFGSVQMQVDSSEGETYYIKSAVLYQNAAADFDTIAQVQSDSSNEILYYPQILEGENNILRLILALTDDSFYDVIFNLGDSLGDSIVYDAADSKVFFSYEGRLTDFEQRTRNMNGRILINKPVSDEKQISGELNTSFELPLDKASTRISTIKLDGTFKVYFGEFRSVSLATGSPLQEDKKKYANNLVLAMMLVAIGVFIFLAR